ncbi:hypothetical protein HDV02_004690 [Globomyces sp. JEL0801]|nr:hypothetical protein HDV02_004690 [Globomyces sp. JEL0801]
MFTFVDSFFENTCFSVLEKTRVGSIYVLSADQPLKVFGQKSKLKATLTVKDRAFWQRVVLHGDIGFAEGYMAEEIDVDDLATFLYICIQNRQYYSEMKVLPFGLNYLLNRALNSSIPNTIYNSLFNIQAHYDLGNELFTAFLDPTMTYSCPIWKDEQDDDLEGAQLRKIHSLLEMANIKKGMKVLEVGTGWGALAIEAVKKYDCEVVSITLSQEQKVLAEERIELAGYSDKITVLLCDYRNMDPNEYQFDRIVTCEMLEAVGPEFLPVFFNQADQLLKPNGVLSLQVITFPDSRHEEYCQKIDFIQKYIFPGGHCPSVSSLTKAIFQGTQGRLIIDSLTNIGPHYAKCLRLWRERFLASYDQIAAESGKPYYNEEFKRKWEFYFAYCEVGFKVRTLGDIQVRLTREANPDLLEGIPF